MTSASPPDGCTCTARLGVASPNHSTPSWTICHWKSWAPGGPGAVTVNLKVLRSPGPTESLRSRGARPRGSHVQLSAGF